VRSTGGREVLPQLDGATLTASRQFPTCAQKFHWRLSSARSISRIRFLVDMYQGRSLRIKVSFPPWR
jgi:hypothetical protein